MAKKAKKSKVKKTKKVRLAIKKPAKEKPRLMNFKANAAERKVLVARAKKYAKGNISLWLKHAGMNYIPKRKDLSP